jgi:hypothetical protein
VAAAGDRVAVEVQVKDKGRAAVEVQVRDKAAGEEWALVTGVLVPAVEVSVPVASAFVPAAVQLFHISRVFPVSMSIVQNVARK